MSNKPSDDFFEELLSGLPPHMQEGIRAAMLEANTQADTEGAKLASSVVAKITAEAPASIKAGLAHMAREPNVDNSISAFIALMLGEIYGNKIALRQANKEIETLRKAHAAWISDLLDKG